MGHISHASVECQKFTTEGKLMGIRKWSSQNERLSTETYRRFVHVNEFFRGRQRASYNERTSGTYNIHIRKKKYAVVNKICYAVGLSPRPPTSECEFAQRTKSNEILRLVVTNTKTQNLPHARKCNVSFARMHRRISAPLMVDHQERTMGKKDPC